MPSLPTGNITYLFTDVVGSSALWENAPESMRLALRRHDQLITIAVVEAGGVVVRERGEGDSIFAVFESAGSAISAVCRIQHSLHIEPWPHDAPIRVRAALHTGLADLRDGSYYGAVVNRCARLRSLAAAGQTLLSGVTHDLVCNENVPGVTYRALGVHRLKDLQHPERIYQLEHDELPAEFPPLPSLDRYRHNLPIQITSFIGRAQEMAEVRDLLGCYRLVTVAGAGGCGKTRLALEVAAGLIDEYSDGVWLVELDALTDGAAIPQAVASLLGIREQPGSPLQTTLTEALRVQSLLIVLDNCEHLVSACASFCGAILRSAPGVRILATSRETLGVPGEVRWDLPALSMPPDPSEYGLSSAASTDLMDYEATHLFMERARTAAVSFVPRESDTASVVQICRRLDGIPLAIEMAAPWVRTLSVGQLATRLGDRFRFLKGGRDAQDRQRTLEGLVDWSYRLLSESEQVLLRRLSVFSGGWYLEAATSVCGDTELDELGILELHAQLIEKSLIAAEESTPGERRFRMLETVRQYASARLRETEEDEPLSSRHLDWCASLASDASERLQGAEQADCLRQLDRERENLRAALRVGTQPGRAYGDTRGLAIASGLWLYWYMRGNYSEGHEWIARACAVTDGASAAELGAAHNRRGNLIRPLGDHPAAEVAYRRAQELSLEAGDRWGVAAALNNLGMLACDRGRHEEAQSLMEQSLAVYQVLNDRPRMARTYANLGSVANHLEAFDRSEEYLDRALELFREMRDDWCVGANLFNVAKLRSRQGDRAGTLTRCGEALSIFWRLGDQRMIALLLSGIAMEAPDQQLPEAVRLLAAAVRLRAQLGVKVALGKRETHLRERARDYLDQSELDRLENELPSLDELVAIARQICVVEPGSLASDAFD